MKQEIITEEIDAGRYNIVHEEDCNCSFEWHIDSYGDLVDGADGAECWEGNILYVGGTPIAQAIRYDRGESLVSGLCYKDIPEDIRNRMRMPNIVEQGESPNSNTHEDRRRDALIEWLMLSGYELDRDDVRGFGNEYIMILRALPAGEFADTSREEAERWANQYLYNGDAATQAYVGFRFEAEQEGGRVK